MEDAFLGTGGRNLGDAFHLIPPGSSDERHFESSFHRRVLVEVTE